LEEISTGKKVVAASHHGPLNVDTGGTTGGSAVANAIASAINKVRHSGDRVVVGGDFNADPGFTTIKVLESLGYKRHAHDWVDYIFTTGTSGLSSIPETKIIRDTGSDHRGIKTTWSSL